MLLDTLDGMHARATNQCSTVGAILDHWCDSGNIVFIVLTNVILFQIYNDPSNYWWVFFCFMPSIVFNWQLTYCLLTKKEITVAGPEAQTVCSLVLLAYACADYLSPESTYVTDYCRMAVTYLPFVFGVLEWIKYLPTADGRIIFCHSYFIAMHVMIGSLYIQGLVGVMEFFVLMLLIGWYWNGQLTIKYETKNYDYPGCELRPALWVAGIMLTKLANFSVITTFIIGMCIYGHGFYSLFYNLWTVCNEKSSDETQKNTYQLRLKVLTNELSTLVSAVLSQVILIHLCCQLTADMKKKTGVNDQSKKSNYSINHQSIQKSTSSKSIKN
jgi:phosphatidylglycerophosphate synthase